MDKTARKKRDREGEGGRLANSESSASEQLPGKHNLREIAVTDEYMPSRNKRTCYMPYFHLISLVRP